MKIINPKEYREDMGRNKHGARWDTEAYSSCPKNLQQPPGRAEAREAHARRIELHELRYCAMVKESIKKRICPKCELGQLAHHTKPTKHYVCKVCQSTFQHDHYFTKGKQIQEQLFEEMG